MRSDLCFLLAVISPELTYKRMLQNLKSESFYFLSNFKISSENLYRNPGEELERERERERESERERERERGRESELRSEKYPLPALLQIMNDFKAGVPRTAYQGVVTCLINGLRVRIYVKISHLPISILIFDVFVVHSYICLHLPFYHWQGPISLFLEINLISQVSILVILVVFQCQCESFVIVLIPGIPRARPAYGTARVR